MYLTNRSNALLDRRPRDVSSLSFYLMTTQDPEPMAPADVDVEDILADSLAFLHGGEGPQPGEDLIRYGPLALSVAPKVRNAIVIGWNAQETEQRENTLL
jgi:hypothetical protein